MMFIAFSAIVALAAIFFLYRNRAGLFIPPEDDK